MDNINKYIFAAAIAFGAFGLNAQEASRSGYFLEGQLL